MTSKIRHRITNTSWIDHEVKVCHDIKNTSWRQKVHLTWCQNVTKWLPSAISDVLNSLWITFLAILDQYRFFIFFICFTKWLPVAILDVRKSLSISFLAISDRYTTLFFFWNFWQNGWRRPFWMSEFHFRSHFW